MEPVNDQPLKDADTWSPYVVVNDQDGVNRRYHVQNHLIGRVHDELRSMNESSKTIINNYMKYIDWTCVPEDIMYQIDLLNRLD